MGKMPAGGLRGASVHLKSKGRHTVSSLMYILFQFLRFVR